MRVPMLDVSSLVCAALVRLWAKKKVREPSSQLKSMSSACVRVLPFNLLRMLDSMLAISLSYLLWESRKGPRVGLAMPSYFPMLSSWSLDSS